MVSPYFVITILVKSAIYLHCSGATQMLWYLNAYRSVNTAKASLDILPYAVEVCKLFIIIKNYAILDSNTKKTLIFWESGSQNQERIKFMQDKVPG